MASGTLQVRDIPADVLEQLKRRAERNGLSLSAYVREVLARDAAQEPVEDVMARIASREPIDVTNEEILSAIHSGRK